MFTVGVYGDVDVTGQHRSHDHGVAVMQNGAVIYSCELERFTQHKHDGRLNEYISKLLKPWLNNEDDVQWVLANSFMSNQFHSDCGDVIFEDIADFTIEEMLKTTAKNKHLIAHEIAHIGTCLPFFGDFKANSLLIHIDGGASKSCASAWYFDGNQIRHLDHSWHVNLKQAVNNFNANPLSAKILNLSLDDHLSLPGKLMGLASYGQYSQALHQNLKINNWYMDNAEVVDVEGMKGADIAACMQREIEIQALSYIEKFKKNTGATSLYYSGGAALNIHVNTRIERELGFKNVYIPPAPSDCGLALGAAAFFEWQKGSEIKIHNAFLNHIDDSDGVNTEGIEVFKESAKAAALIAAGEVVAVFKGDAEIGPRALGHRSLLIRPDSKSLRKYLSEDIKQREWYRPVAPIMLSEVAEAALIDYKPDSNLSLFMLGAWQIKSTWKMAFSGCIHADDSVRAQVVNKTASDNDHIYHMLRTLHDEYQIYGVINTSFNGRGVPIVGSFQQAIDEAKNLGVKYLWSP